MNAEQLPPTRLVTPKMSRKDTVISSLTQEIKAGHYGHDGKLPTQLALCDRFGFSLITIRDALKEMANDGLVTPVHGHGWFVRSEHLYNYPIITLDENGVARRDMEAWKKWLHSEGLTATYELIVKIEEPPAHIADHLRLNSGSKCVIRRRLRSINDERVWISTGHFPLRLSDGTPLAEGRDFARAGSNEKVKYEKGGISDLAESGFVPTRIEDHFICRMPSSQEKESLRLEQGIPVQVTCRTFFDEKDRPITCTHNVIASHRFSLVIGNQMGAVGYTSTLLPSVFDVED